ncbi:hypothetical protein [Aurantiacibacter spongiae]|uniref:Uncharacterized protein n=1 Tax=Aurantiacibacter spongiae TaxID=2488860 RepID=A0A3N5CPF5_9SPHN|nr:hypothetical protein [Aurantiacibacter spongiae]RPF70457.1 hypothetical protein EG799_01540 [Aurantiacibacter spongiae]
MNYEPTAHDVTHGVEMDVLAALPRPVREIIIVVAARAAERAYRRGFQQGHHLATACSNAVVPDLHDWRYGNSTDLSIAADGPPNYTAKERLFMENDGLRVLETGFHRRARKREVPTLELTGDHALDSGFQLGLMWSMMAAKALEESDDLIPFLGQTANTVHTELSGRGGDAPR